MPSMRRNASLTKAKRLTKTPDCNPKTAQPTLQNTTCPNSNRHQEHTPALSHSAAHASRGFHLVRFVNAGHTARHKPNALACVKKS